MTGDFNIRDNNWDLFYLHYSTYADMLRKITDSFNLELLSPVVQVSTQYVNNLQGLNSVLDLMFLWANVEEFNNHMISLNLWESSDHTSLSVCIIIKKEFIQDKKLAIVKNSKKEKEFVNDLKNRISCIDMSNIHNHDMLEDVTQEFASITKKLWYKHSKLVNITKQSKT